MRLRGWQTFERLSWRDRWILSQALVLLPLASVTLRVVSFARLQALLSSRLPSPSPVAQRAAPDRIRMTTELVWLAAHRGLVPVTCLPHSLVLWWLLRRDQAEAVLRVGVRKATGDLEAHAWVEHDGVVLNDRADVHERYAAFEQGF